MTRTAVVSVLRTATLPDPYVPSVEGHCADCHEPVLISITSRDAVIALEGELPPLVCEVCIVRHVAGMSGS